MSLSAPFPWFGGKRLVADAVWTAFGDVDNFVEPFAGSLAVLLGRPEQHTGSIETVNDLDGFIANFWRAMSADPDAVARYADWPVSEPDLHARHSWLVRKRERLTERLMGDPEFFDAKIAGWWVWGICSWIGSGWCSGNGPWQSINGALVKSGTSGTGINRQLPHLSTVGQGINRQLPGTTMDRGEFIRDWFVRLSRRLRAVRVCSGDWSRVLTPSVTHRHGMTGVFLDPPYGADNLTHGLYHDESVLTADVRAWAIEHGDHPRMRIALCGYEGEHEMPDGWTVYHWKANGGYGSQGSNGSINSSRETIWLSPHCISPQPQLALW